MKVYKAKKEIIFTGPIYKIIKQGEKLYQEGEYYLAESGYYPISKSFIEDRPDDYEQLPDDEHDSGYYLLKVYSQYEMDITILSLSEALKK
jgi:hypothetical protein